VLVKNNGVWKLSPAKLVVLGFAAVIFVGSVLLTLPAAVAGARDNSYVDALFTATSAVCVTGLVVVDTGTFYSRFGQVIILLLIQVGGLGIVTVASIYAFLLRKRIGLRERLVMKEALNVESLGGIVRLVRAILLMTFLIEGVGALLLTLTLWNYFGFGKALYYGVFHAVSAFCNAGFDLFGREFYQYCSLIPFRHDWRVLGIIGSMILLGGLGFPVLVDLRRQRRFKTLSLHSKVVLITTGLLIILGCFLFWGIERDGVLQGTGVFKSMVNSLFMSITPRTAGYTSVDVAKLEPSTLLVLTVLMFIGASPVSTGGGIKTATMAVLVMAVYSRLRGRFDTEAFGRRIDSEIVYRALTVAVLSALLVGIGIIVLSLVCQVDIMKLIFEAVSAFGTVGLSTGITPQLNTGSKVILIVLMFAGRLGPLTLAFSLLQQERKETARYPRGNVIIG